MDTDKQQAGERAGAAHARLAKLLGGPVPIAPAVTSGAECSRVTAIHARLGKLLPRPAR